MSLQFDDRDRESIVQDLRSADEEVRRLAVERVEMLAASEAVACLIECLGDSSWRVRKAAVARLVASPDAVGVAGALVAALADGENPGRRNAAVEALVNLGARVVPSLIDASASDDHDVRKQVVDALAGIADPSAGNRLRELLDDPDPNVRAAACDALGAIGGEAVPANLLALVRRADEDQLVRFSAIRALTVLEFPACASDLTAVLDDAVLGPAALDLLGRDDDDDAIEVLLKALVASSRARREAAMRSLLRIVGRADPNVAPSIIERIRRAAAASERVVAKAVDRLPEADLPTQLVLIQFLGLVRAPQGVVPVLLAGADEALAQVAAATLESLGELAEEKIDAAWSQLDPDSRRDACRLFGRTTGPLGAARLTAALDDSANPVRAAAARSLGSRRLESALPLLVGRLTAAAADGDFESEEELSALTDGLIALAQPTPDAPQGVTQRAVELLTERLDAAGDDVRLAIATVLGRIGRQEDSDVVTFLLKDPSPSVRRSAVEALARLEPGTAVEPLRLALADESASVRISAAHALGASESDEVGRDLERLADDEDPRVRAAAVSSVIRRFTHASDPALREVASRVVAAAVEDEAGVVLGALESLTEVGGPHARSAEKLLSRPEPELVRAAVRCIATHSDELGVESIMPLVSHPDWAVRAEAIQTLADRGITRGVPAILRRLETESDDFVRGVTLRALERLESEMG